MIKKILVAILMAFPMLLSAQTLKVGLVNTNEIFSLMPDTQAAQAELERVQKQYQDEATKLEDELRRLYEDFQNMKQDELPAIRERKAQEIQSCQQKMQTFEQNASQDIQRKQNELMQPIMAKINQAIESVGKEGSYSMVMPIENTLYFSAPVENITPQVKAKLGLK